MIEVEGLTKYYGDFAAVKDLSFTVEKGEILGFLGPNGAGKTTTMRILSGYMPPSEGSAKVAGYDVFKQSMQARRHIGYMPENVPLYKEMTVAGYLDYMGSLRRVEDRRQRVGEVMEKVNIIDRADDRIATLSKGYRQRVGLAQALLHNPDVVILDEPTIGLDPRQIIDVRQLIRDLQGEHTVILSSHILPEVSEVSTRIIIINHGRIVAVDTPQGLTALLSGGERVVLELRNAPPADKVIAALSTLPGVNKIEATDKAGQFDLRYEAEKDPRPLIARTIVQNDWDLLELHYSTMSLEEIFLHLVVDEKNQEEAA